MIFEASTEGKQTRPTDGRSGTGWWTLRDRRDVFALILIVLVGATHFLARTHRRPDTIHGIGYVTGEAGNQLLRADLIRSGHVIYRDFACQYGILPSYAYAGLAALIGNTIDCIDVYNVVLRVCANLLFYLILRRVLPPGRSLAFSILVGGPSLLPFAGLGTYTQAESISMEVVLFATIMAMYTTPDRRTVAAFLGIGFCLGVWQWVKFGGAFIAGATIVGLDFLWILRRRPGREVVIRWLVQSTWTLGAFVFVEALLAALLFSICPYEIARDALWPFYMIGDYSTKVERWPEFSGWRFFLTSQLLPTSGLILGGIALAYETWKGFSDRGARSMGGYLGWGFFVLGLFFYLKHRYLIYQYSWTLIPLACQVVGRMPFMVRLPWILAGCLSSALIAKISLVNPKPEQVVAINLRHGDRIYGDAAERGTIEALNLAVGEIRARGHQGDLLFVASWMGGGFYHYLDRPIGTRNWFIVLHGFRPYDDRELLRKLDGVSAFLWIDDDDPADRLGRVFSPALTAAILEQFPLRGLSGRGLSHSDLMGPVTWIERKVP